MYTPNTPASARTFCYDYQTANSDTLSIITHDESVAFVNPTVTRLNGPNGQKALVVTYFLPGEGAALGEEGPLIFYKYINECQSGI
uniref:Uncharacterized protein n=1 Tax=Acrobeloides nanus TaxID=290746 RepID=A0A914DMQ1_9BILA